jgi:hypothetical protein
MTQVTSLSELIRTSLMLTLVGDGRVPGGCLSGVCASIFAKYLYPKGRLASRIVKSGDMQSHCLKSTRVI